jgi:hypothetical protein
VTVKRSTGEDRTVEELETTGFLQMILGEIFLEERSTLILILFIRGRGRGRRKTVREKSIFPQIFSGNSDRRDEQIPEIAILFLGISLNRTGKRKRERGENLDESFPKFLSDFLNKREKEEKEKEKINEND